MSYVQGTPRSFFKSPKGGRHAAGFTLIEVLVTLVVVSIGMLSIAQLQARALQHSHSSLQRTVAVVQANDLLERMWSGYCDETAFPGTIHTDWRAASTHPLLPGRTDSLTWTGASNPEFTLTISWQDLRARDNTAPSFTYVFRMLDPDLSTDLSSC
jgi:type IV pilus assembly protein PilV